MMYNIQHNESTSRMRNVCVPYEFTHSKNRLKVIKNTLNRTPDRHALQQTS